MITFINIRRYAAAESVTALVACLALVIVSCTQPKTTMTVQEAYDLRMSGHADSAEVGLMALIAADSTNAAAWYELARIEHHLGLGNPQELFDRLGQVELAMDTATRLDPRSLTYSFYRAYIKCTNAYASLMRNQADAAEKVSAAVAALESIEDLSPKCAEPMLFLVEFLSIPAELGGDSAKADAYAQKLAALDGVLGAKAREILLPDDADRLEFWRGILAEHGDNPDVLEQVGKAYLYQEDVEQGTKYVEDALAADPKRQRLVLDLVRYHMMRARSDEEGRGEALDTARGLLKRYVDGGPVPPLKAYALGLCALVESGKGNSEGFEEFKKQASAIDPHFSKAFGAPPPVLFTAPDEVPRFHSYFFRPF